MNDDFFSMSEVILMSDASTSWVTENSYLL